MTWEIFRGIFSFPWNQEQGDAISQTRSGRTPGRQHPGQGIILCPRDVHIPTSEVVLSHRLTPNSQMMPKTPGSLQGKDASSDVAREKVASLPEGPKTVQLPSPPHPKQPLRPLPTQGRARRGAHAREVELPATTEACPRIAACIPESMTSNCQQGRWNT